ncbi:MAG: 2,3-bisphosphoglycerate-dependent phosphoglycerate mutase [Verrucomicrobiota bacterium]|nr:2,3-bisphosphoglycerate-dependent phosphoglycerate mutase [Verrucomicrobiota bacterium]
MPAKLILMRHGQSAWNQKNLFTGWVDIPLSEKGVQESIEGGDKIKDIPIDVIYTSTLVRAHQTLALAMMNHSSGKLPVFLHEGGGKLEEWAHIYSDETKNNVIPVHMAWELNERMYGKLQGLNKAEMTEKFGAEQVQLWRRSFDVAPPEGESLSMTAKRTIPYFQKKILPHLEQGENVFIPAHGNSLRSIVMFIEQLSKEEVVKLELATGEPRIYTYERGRWYT